MTSKNALVSDVYRLLAKKGSGLSDVCREVTKDNSREPSGYVAKCGWPFLVLGLGDNLGIVHLLKKKKKILGVTHHLPELLINLKFSDYMTSSSDRLPPLIGAKNRGFQIGFQIT